jgi:hypothetical protein
MESQRPKIHVIRSVWRRLKKEKGRFVKVSRDLEPVKDVKGGSGVAGNSKPTTGSSDTAGSQ